MTSCTTKYLDEIQLPDLPKPLGVFYTGIFYGLTKKQPTFQFTADQMRGFACQAILEHSQRTPGVHVLKKMLVDVWTKLAFLIPHFQHYHFDQTSPMAVDVAFEHLAHAIREAKKLGGSDEHKVGVEVTEMLDRLSPGWDANHKTSDDRARGAAWAVMHLRGKSSRSMKAWDQVVKALDIYVPKWRDQRPYTTTLDERAVMAIARLARAPKEVSHG